jgi:hypothetical protein
MMAFSPEAIVGIVAIVIMCPQMIFIIWKVCCRRNITHRRPGKAIPSRALLIAIVKSGRSKNIDIAYALDILVADGPSMHGHNVDYIFMELRAEARITTSYIQAGKLSLIIHYLHFY